MTLHSNDLTTSASWDEQWVHANQSPLYKRLRWLIVRKSFKSVCGQIDALKYTNPKVLEIGCAPGTFLEYMYDFRPQYQLSGLDYAVQGVELTRKRLQMQGVPAHVFQSDLRHFAPEETYEVVLSWGLVEHFKDPVSIIKHHARLAADGGLVVIVIPNYAPKPVRFFIQRFDPQALHSHNLNLMNQEVLYNAFMQAGLQQIQTFSVGGPQFRATCAISSLSSRIYRTSVRVWNIIAAILPVEHIGWDMYLGVSGRVQH
jgi:2-polyprenyl-3-methyl-5-hydroxy-6-metoxy-1,4-benzoquinol methylase